MTPIEHGVRRKRIVHGTPITPKRLLPQVAGASFCVSYMAPEQLDDCIELVGDDEILILDNGAFSAWRKGIELDSAWWDSFYAWANDAMSRCPQAVAVIPDVIGGSEADNLRLVAEAVRLEKCHYPERLMPVWHMNESLDQLETFCRIFNFVAWGSCAEVDISKSRPGSEWRTRANEAAGRMDWVQLKYGGERPWLHMMRGLGVLHFAGFDSADSTNMARNHNRTKGQPDHVAAMARRIDVKIHGCPTVTDPDTPAAPAVAA